MDRFWEVLPMCASALSPDNAVVPDDISVLLQLGEFTDDVLWSSTPDVSELVFVNSTFEDIFGMPTEKVNADPTSCLEAIHPDYRETVQNRMAAVSSGEPVELECPADPSQGCDTWVGVQSRPVHDDAGELQYVAGYVRDITERKRYQDELEEQRRELEHSNESLQEFAYIASHDLQEPLRMVSSYIDLLEQEYGEQLDDEAAEYMADAVDGAQRMKRMIESLLEYSRVLTDAKDFEQVDVTAVLADIRQDLELRIAEHDAELVVGNMPEIEADRDQIGQLFQNLLKNAIEHGGDEGTVVEVTATEHEDANEVAVSDNGPGIPEANHDDVFKIFSKGAGGTDATGTGIGLAVAERIVRRHGGSIEIESAPGEGTTFLVTIPNGSVAHNPAVTTP